MQLLMVADDAPGVLLQAIGPTIRMKNGIVRRGAPIFRLRHVEEKFIIENKHGTASLGRWKALGHSTDFVTAMKQMQKLNGDEMAKRGLKMW